MNKLWIYEKINPTQYLHLPYYEWAWMVKEWIEYIDAKIKRQEAERAEYEAEKKKVHKTSKLPTPKFPSKLK